VDTIQFSDSEYKQNLSVETYLLKWETSSQAFTARLIINFIFELDLQVEISIKSKVIYAALCKVSHV
jgi:hypothetical protein